MERFKQFLMFIHQLPQNIIGFLLCLFYKGEDEYVWKGKNDVCIRSSARMCGGISLGQYVIVGAFPAQTTQKHELGHCLQSQKLGWLYLFVIGIPSILWALVYDLDCINSRWSYYQFYTEKSADKLGGVHRVNRK